MYILDVIYVRSLVEYSSWTLTTESDMEIHMRTRASVTSSSAECAEAKIVSESCGQVNVTPAESVKEHSPDVKCRTRDTGEARMAGAY